MLYIIICERRSGYYYSHVGRTGPVPTFLQTTDTSSVHMCTNVSDDIM